MSAGALMPVAPVGGARGGPAVMSRRREPGGSLDDFPTPPWAVRALTERLLRSGLHSARLAASRCREPAAGRGHMARALGEVFGSVEQIDVQDYGTGNLDLVADFTAAAHWPAVDWTITNPPFRLAERFIDAALRTSTAGVAMLVRTQFLEGTGRFERIFARDPPSRILQFTERVVMLRGRLANPNIAREVVDPATGEIVLRKPSTATAYCWLVWDLPRLHEGTRLLWLPPCRRRLERQEDYA